MSFRAPMTDPLERVARAPASPQAWVTAVRGRLLWRGLGWAWLGALTLALLGLGLWLAFGVGEAPARPLPWLRALVALGIGGALVATALAIGARLRRGPGSALGLLGRRDSALAEDLGSALELARGHDGSGSELGRAFVICHRDRVEGRLAEVPPGELVPLVGLGQLARALALLAAAALLGLLFVPEAPERLAAHLGLHGGADTLPRVLRGPAAQPLRVEVRPPRYTGLEPVVHPPGDGAIPVPEGSRVTLLAEADHPVRAARATWPGGSGAGDLLGERAFRVRFTLVGSEASGPESVAATPAAPAQGEVVLAVRDEAGVWRVGARGQPFAVTRDAPPRVSAKPEAAVIRLERARAVPLGWEAADDYGLTQVRLVYRVDDGPRREVALGSGPRFGSGRRTRLAGEHRLDLAALRLAAGSVVRFHLEAEDNRSLAEPRGGPQKTASPSQEIRIEGSRAARRDVLEGVRPLLEQALAALADRYERPPRAPAGAPPPACLAALAELERQQGAELALAQAYGAFVSRVREGAKDLAPILRDVVEGPLARLATRLAEVTRGDRAARPRGAGASGACGRLGRAGAGHDAVVAALEELALELDALTGRATLEEMKDVVRRVDQLRKEVRRLTEELRARGDPATRREIARRAAEIRRELSRLSRLAASLGDEVMDEHVNRYALSQRAKRDALDQLGKPGRGAGDPLAALDRVVEELKQAVSEGLDRFRQVMPLPGEEARQRHADGVKSLAEAQRRLTGRIDRGADPQRLSQAQRDLAREARRLAALAARDGRGSQAPKGAKGEREPKGAKGEAKGAAGKGEAPAPGEGQGPPGATPPAEKADPAAELREAAARMERAAEALGRGEKDAGKRLAAEALRLLRSAQAAAERAGRITPPREGDGGELEDRGGVEIPPAGGALPRDLRRAIQEAGRERWPAPYREPLRRYYESLLR